MSNEIKCELFIKWTESQNEPPKTDNSPTTATPGAGEGHLVECQPGQILRLYLSVDKPSSAEQSWPKLQLHHTSVVEPHTEDSDSNTDPPEARQGGLERHATDPVLKPWGNHRQSISIRVLEISSD